MPRYKSPDSKIGCARVLSIITERPDIHVSELRAACPEAGRCEINTALYDLMRGGGIERTGYGHYALPARKRHSPPPAVIVRGQSLAWLMAGR